MTSEALEKKVQRAIFTEAAMRWETAVPVLGGLVASVAAWVSLIPTGTVPAWSYLVGGLTIGGILFTSSILDPNFREAVAAKQLRFEFKPERLRDKRLQQGVNDAIDYRNRIELAIREQDSDMLSSELANTASQIDAWLENIYNLALRIDRYQQERAILERDQQRTQSRIQQLNKQLTTENNPAIRQQIEATLDSMNRQLATLDKLSDTIERARLQFENSLVHLSTIYSQTMLVNVQDIDSSRARRLRQEIKEEVVELDDMLTAMDDVYRGGGLSG